MTIKQKKIEDLQKTLQEMEKSFQDSVGSIKKQIEALEKSGNVKALESGFYWDLYEGHTLPSNCFDEYHEKGQVFSTRKQTEDTNKIITESYMIAQYLYAKEPDYAPDWSNEYEVKCSIHYYQSRYRVTRVATQTHAGCVYMPFHVADQLVEELNSGTYSLEGFK